MPSSEPTQASLPEEDIQEEKIDDEDVLDVDPETEVLPLPYSITSFGADFLVDGLVARIDNGDIVIPHFEPEVETVSGIEGFQRQFIWTKPQIDKFIESLLFGLPVPGIFLVQEPNNVLLVLDGQQRLLSMWSFKKGILRGREFRLRYVDEAFYGLRYQDLDEEDRRRFDNSIIHATIVRQDAPPEDQSSIYSIFERLNTGGTPLQPHEIRVALYRGRLIRLLRDLNQIEAWRELYGPRSSRLKDQELILRFFALFYRAEDYERPLKGFLNDFVEDHTNLEELSEEELTTLFESTVEAILAGIGRQAFRPKKSLNAAVVDSVMVGVAHRLEAGEIENVDALQEAYQQLIADPEYQAATESSTAAEESVSTRLRLAEEALAEVS